MPQPQPRDGTSATRPDRGRHRRTAEAILKTLALYGFAGWAYIALNATFHPETLGLPLSHLASWPHEDTFGVACFAISLISFLALNLLRASADQA